ncbi:MAG: serine protease, partial [Verrucomicrobiota bacterium]|nr:serine protease [Verrucomicrobiota bacterium]
RYYVYAGLVFTPLTLDYVKTFGRNWRNVANLEMVYELYYRKNEKPESARKEPVVLAATLAHPVNADIRLASRAMIDKINGKRIESLEDLIDAFKNNDKNQHLIKFGSGTIESLDTEKANQAHKDILETYSIPSDRRL